MTTSLSLMVEWVDGGGYLGFVWIQLILLKTKNTVSKIIFKYVKNYCSLFFYCSYALVYCSWDMNSASGVDKKKEKTHKRGRRNVDPNSTRRQISIIYILV